MQPLDDAKEDDEYSAGESGKGGKGGSSASGGSTTGGKGGSNTGGKGGTNTGGAGGAKGGTGGGNTGGSSAAGGTGGSSGKGGTGGAGGLAGWGGSGNTTGLVVYNAVWTFDEDLQGFAVGYSEPQTLGIGATTVHDPDDGEPDDGAVALTLPFDGPMQTVELGVPLPRILDLTGQTLAARVKLDSGFFGNTPEPGGVKVFVKTGDSSSVYADGAWSDLVEGEWITAVFDLSAPDSDDGIDPTDVREIGLTFKSTAADAGWTTGTFHVDTVGWTNAERPACILDTLLIDDMESPDGFGRICQVEGRTASWFAFGDDSDGVFTPDTAGAPLPLEDIDVPRAGNQRAIRVQGSGFTDYGGAVGTTLVPGNIEVSTSWNAVSYAGIAFYARGSGTMTVRLSTPPARDATQDYPGECLETLGFKYNDSYSAAPFELANGWRGYVIPFATLRQEGWGMPAPFSYDISAIEFSWGTNASFDFWIDDLRFLPRECEDGATVECFPGGQRCSRGTLVQTDCTAECAARGYLTSACQANGCVCSDPSNEDIAIGIDALCVCGEPNLACPPETAALLEVQGAIPGSVRDTILCYAMYPNPTADQCVTALAAVVGASPAWLLRDRVARRAGADGAADGCRERVVVRARFRRLRALGLRRLRRGLGDLGWRGLVVERDLHRLAAGAGGRTRCRRDGRSRRGGARSRLVE